MFGIFTVTVLLETIIFMPATYTVLRLSLPPVLAFAIACIFNAVAVGACFICKLKPGTLVYRLLTFALSAVIAWLAAGFSPGGFITLVICIFIFSRVRSDMASGRDIAVQASTGAIILNIILAIVYAYSSGSPNVALFGNAAIFASTVAAVIVLVLRQVDDSRRFGKNSMGISSTQRKNNRLFAGIMLAALLVAGSVGQVSNIYKFVLGLIGKFFMLLAYLFTPSKADMPSAAGQQLQEFFTDAGVEDPSLFDKIMMVAINVVAVIILIAAAGFVLYKLFKFVVGLAIRLINWLKGGGEHVERVSEYGHTDEKQSLINRNIKNMANRLQAMTAGLFNRETPYGRLPDDISKVRRLFKHFSSSAGRSGVKITNVSTAREICGQATGISPEEEGLNTLMADCYDRARYNEAAPSLQDLHRLEEKLLK